MNYFEHVYLSRYLGYTLVQGNDLTVRDARVFLKTLSGLHPVDVILRASTDDFCDPLELYPNSFLGVPGLIQAAREGNADAENALAAGVLQGPGFLRPPRGRRSPPARPGSGRHARGTSSGRAPGIAEVVVDAAQDHVDGMQPAERLQEDPGVAHGQVVPLDPACSPGSATGRRARSRSHYRVRA